MLKGIKIFNKDGVYKLLTNEQYISLEENNYINLVETINRFNGKTLEYSFSDLEKRSTEEITLEIDDYIYDRIYEDFKVYSNRVYYKNNLISENKNIDLLFRPFIFDIYEERDIKGNLDLINKFIPVFFDVKKINEESTIIFCNNSMLPMNCQGSGFKIMCNLINSIGDTIKSNGTLIIPGYLGFHPILEKAFFMTLLDGKFQEAMGLEKTKGQFIYEDSDYRRL